MMLPFVWPASILSQFLCQCKGLSAMMAGWMLGKTFHLSFGLSSFFFTLKDLRQVRKFIVSSQYSCLSRMFETLPDTRLQGMSGRFLHFLPLLFLYSVGVSTCSVFSCLAIYIDLSSETHSPKIFLTISAAGSSISHSSLLFGFFIYPKGGSVVSGTPDILSFSSSRERQTFIQITIIPPDYKAAGR